MGDADKFLSVFRWAIEHGGAPATDSEAGSALDGVDIRDLPGPASDGGASQPPKPMSTEDREFLENAIKSITVDEVEQVRSLARTISRAAGLPIQPLMEKGARVAKDGSVLAAPRPAASAASVASESKEGADRAGPPDDEVDPKLGPELEAAVAEDPERLADALDELNLFCSSSDNSTILGAMGGMVPLVRLTAHPAPRVAAGASEALSTVVQNHPTAQGLALRSGALHAVLRRLQKALARLSGDEASPEASGEARVATKSVLALSSLMGGFAPAQDVALQMASLSALAHDGAPGAASAPLPPPGAEGKPRPAGDAEERKTAEDESAAPAAPASGTSASTAMILSPAAAGGGGAEASTTSSAAAAGLRGADDSLAGRVWLGGAPVNPPVLLLLLQAMLLRGPGGREAEGGGSTRAWPDRGRLRQKASRCLLRLLQGPRGLAVCSSSLGRAKGGEGGGEGGGGGAWPLLGALASCAAQAVPSEGDGGPPLWEGGVPLQVAETAVRCICAVLRATVEVLLRGPGGGEPRAAASGAGAGGELDPESVAERTRELLRQGLAGLARASAAEGVGGSLQQAVAAVGKAAEYACSASSAEDKEVMEDLLREATEASKLGALAIRKAS